ncbi:MAG: BatD family protein [Flavobacteriaceae bacterium]|tara:strand:- start:1087 stop:2796 length:1710 start_codon:yes stop_codon:yes gene_type:complete
MEGQVTFEAKVSKRRLGLNERLRVDFEMNENGDNFNPPSFSNFQVVSGPQQAVSRSWINGVQSFSKIYTYFLTPKIKGKVSIGQAVVTIGGEIYKTTPVEIEVTNSVKKPNDPNNVDNIVDGNIHLVAEVSKSAPYLNEGITVIYKLYFRNPISVSDVSELETPTYGDFWSHLIKIGRAEINMRGSYKGEPYNEVIWRKAVLYPQKTGKLVLEPLTLNLSLSTPSNRRDLFGRRIMTQTQKTITTGEKVITVKQLPQNNKPENFSGAVGQFDFDVILNKDLLKASESFQAKIKVKGKGNLKLFNLPIINVPNTLEVYEPEHDEKVKITISGMQGTIEDNYTIVPQFQGKYPIPSIQFSYFDPKSKSYKILKSQNLIVDVFEGPTAANTNQKSIVPKTSIRIAESAFRFIKLETKFESIDQKSFWRSRIFWILILIPVFLLSVSFFIKSFLYKKNYDNTIQKQRRAEQLTKKYLSSAKKHFDNQAQFYEVLERALHNYLKAKLKIETTELSKSKIKTLLHKNSVDEKMALEYVEVIESCERARYSSESLANMRDDFKKASSLIGKIDRQI